MKNAFAAYPHLARKLYVRPQNYSGMRHDGTATVTSINRDSHALELSNWDHIVAGLTAIEPEVELDDDDTRTIPDGWYITREGHWAVGWVEVLRISPNASDIVKAFSERMLERLENYHALDEDDVSDREWNAAANAWETTSVRERAREIARYNEWARASVSVFAARRDYIGDDDMRQWWHEKINCN